MPQVPMFDAISGSPASAAHNNAIIDNVQDHETRMVTVENRTTNTSGNVGIGNQRLSDRMGAGITTAAPADTRLATVESTTTNGTTGNAALGTRVTALEATSGLSPIVRATRFSAASVATAQNAYTYIAWTAAPRNPNTMWAGGNPTRLTVPSGQGGLYSVNAMILVLPTSVNAASTMKAVGIRVNGAGSIIRSGAPWMGVINNFTEMIVQMHVELSASDYIEIGVWHNYGTPSEITIGSDAGAPWVVMRKIA